MARGDHIKNIQNPKNVDPSENKKMIGFMRDIMSWGAVDLSDHEAVERRLNEYLDYCEEHDTRPLVTGMASAIGINRVNLWDIVKNDHNYKNVTRESKEVLRRFYELLEMYLEGSLSDEKSNVVKWIFLAKNNHGWVDQKETVVRRDDAEQLRLGSADDVAKKYSRLAGKDGSKALQGEVLEVKDIPESD